MEITRKRDMGSLTFERELGVDDHLTDRERVRATLGLRASAGGTAQRNVILRTHEGLDQAETIGRIP